MSIGAIYLKLLLEVALFKLCFNVNLNCSSFSGQILAREWIKYECGVFSEQGFNGDRLYPAMFNSGNTSIANQGMGSESN